MYDTANPVSSRASDEDYILPRKLRRGDNVFIPELNRKGIISGEPDGSEFVFVQMGVMKTKMNVSKLRLVESEKPINAAGKGTGLLRNAVHRRLKSHPSIKSFRLGVYGEGEDGVTVAELK